ncbi:MAG TPA: ABC transporter substrate-binding protein [Pyrinomonadaceae bacterium]|nr:ABC transporter substrate-binding protein [Pyrinomonadaceae bacterium]
MLNFVNYHCKLFLSLLGLSLLFLSFAACGGNKRTGTETELIIGVRADDYIIEPLKSRRGVYPLNTQICESLVRITADYRIEPLLATRWERRGNTWRFFLRPNVFFSTGQPLTSEAVKYTFERMVKGDAPGVFHNQKKIKLPLTERA